MKQYIFPVNYYFFLFEIAFVRRFLLSMRSAIETTFININYI